MTLDESTGTTTYNGNVELSQGSIKVKADTIVIHNINGSIESMHMSGNHNPATFEQETINGELARGQAMHIQYDSRNSKLTLTGSAKMQQGKNKIRSHRIDYNSATNNLSAGNPIDPGKKQHDSQRVRIVITPDENNPE
jgi:lipopolysaccharide export system protein LptA